MNPIAAEGFSGSVLAKAETRWGTLLLCKNEFTCSGRGRFTIPQGLLELSLSGRTSSSEIMFEGEKGGVKGERGQLAYYPESIPFRSAWTTGCEISVCCLVSREGGDYLKEFSRHDLEHALSLQSPRILTLMQDMATEIQRNDFGREMVLNAIFCQLLVLLSRYFDLSAVSTVPAKAVRLTRSEVSRIIERFDGRRGMPTVRALAGQLGYSEAHLSRILQEAIGCKVSHYITSKRMEVAQDLLIETSLNIKEIAFELGYGVAEDFTRAFKRHTGVTPREFRKNAG